MNGFVEDSVWIPDPLKCEFADVLGTHGALQQAIEDANLNGNLAQNTSAGFTIPAATVTSYKYKNVEAGTGRGYQGAPGYLSQADLLGVSAMPPPSAPPPSPYAVMARPATPAAKSPPPPFAKPSSSASPSKSTARTNPKPPPPPSP